MKDLKLKNVSYKYKQGMRSVLEDVTCTFEPGKVYSIVGHSGSGKTTLLSLMAGLDRPSNGKIYLGNQDLSSMSLDQYRREDIGIIFQAFHLLPFLSAIENVAYPMRQNGMNAKEAKTLGIQLLESVQLTSEHGKRYPSNLSGGEQQRVAIARALASGAKIILADEPTGNLDVENSEGVMKILRNLAHQHGYCIILVTHNLEIAGSSDKVYRLQDGKIIVQDLI